jgi:hypothetical protein
VGSITDEVKDRISIDGGLMHLVDSTRNGRVQSRALGLRWTDGSSDDLTSCTAVPNGKQIIVNPNESVIPVSVLIKPKLPLT